MYKNAQNHRINNKAVQINFKPNSYNSTELTDC